MEKEFYGMVCEVRSMKGNKLVSIKSSIIDIFIENKVGIFMSLSKFSVH